MFVFEEQLSLVLRNTQKTEKSGARRTTLVYVYTMGKRFLQRNKIKRRSTRKPLRSGFKRGEWEKSSTKRARQWRKCLQKQSTKVYVKPTYTQGEQAKADCVSQRNQFKQSLQLKQAINTKCNRKKRTTVIIYNTNTGSRTETTSVVNNNQTKKTCQATTKHKSWKETNTSNINNVTAEIGTVLTCDATEDRQENKVKNSPRVDQLCVSTFNVRTLNDKLKNDRPLSRLVGLLKQNDIDICGVQEVKRSGKQHLREEGYDFYHSDGGNKNLHGVGIAIKSDIAKNNKIYIKHSTPRILYLTMMVMGKNSMVNLIVAHAPTEVTQPAHKQEFYDELDTIMKSIKREERTFLMMDANARTGSKTITSAGVVGNFGLDVLNDNGKMLINFCQKHKLCLTNTHFRKTKSQHTYTKKGKNSVIHKWRLDYVITKQSQKQNILDAEVVENSETFGSDHRLVKMTFKYKLNGRPSRYRRKQKTKKSIDFGLLKLKDGEQTNEAQFFVDKVDEEISTLNGVLKDEKKELNLEERSERLEEVIRNSGETHLVTEKSDSFKELTYKSTVETKKAELKAYRDTMYKKYVESKQKDSLEYKEYRKAQKVLRKMQRKIKIRVMEIRCNELGTAYKEESSAYFYRVAKLNILEEKVQDTSILLYSEDEKTVIYEDEGIRDRLVEYTEGLLNDEFEPSKQLIENMEQERRPPEIDLDRKPDEEEIKEAILSLKNNKATGIDGIPAECFKALAYTESDGFDELVWCIEKVWETGNVPQQWKDTVFVYIYKNKGSRLKCSNYRGIALSSHIGKIVLTIIKKRIEKYAEKNGLLPEEQFGFRKNRSTIDGLFMMRRLSEEVTKNNEKLHTVFVDLKKAYDTVDRTLMWAILKKYGIPEKTVNVIKGFYEGMQNRVKYAGKLSEPFETIRGLRQGCILSPLLFLLYIAEVMEKVENGLPKTVGVEVLGNDNKKSVINNIFFADDASFFDKDIENVQIIISQFNKICGDFGLAISVPKTKALTFEADTCQKKSTEETVVIDSEKLEITKNFKYLGGMLSSNTKCETEIEKRKGLAKFNFYHKYKEFFRAWVPRKMKMRIYRTCILPILLYGCGTWTTTKAMINKLESTHMNMLRFIIDKKRRSHIRNKEVLERLKTRTVQEMISYERIKYAGRVEKMKEARLPWKIIKGKVAKDETLRRRNTKSWTMNLEEDLKMFKIDNISREAKKKSWRGKLEKKREEFWENWKLKDDAKYKARKEKEQEKDNETTTANDNNSDSDEGTA